MVKKGTMYPKTIFYFVLVLQDILKEKYRFHLLQLQVLKTFKILYSVYLLIFPYFILLRRKNQNCKLVDQNHFYKMELKI